MDLVKVFRPCTPIVCGLHIFKGVQASHNGCAQPLSTFPKAEFRTGALMGTCSAYVVSGRVHLEHGRLGVDLMAQNGALPNKLPAGGLM